MQAIIESMTKIQAYAAAQQTSEVVVRWEPEVDSTNARLLLEPWHRAGPERADDLSAICLLADHQSAGRGRHRKRWHDEPGACLLMSLLIDRSKAAWPEGLAGFSLACAATVAQRLEIQACLLSAKANSKFWLKWPNDLVRLTQEKGLSKLAGILIETRQHAGQSRLVIGLGVNLLLPQMPSADPQALPADALFSVGDSVAHLLDRDWRMALAKYVSQDLLQCWIDFERHGLAAFTSLIETRDVLRDRRLLVQDEGQEDWFEALGQGIDDRGYLRILSQRSGRLPSLETIHQGSVRLLSR